MAALLLPEHHRQRVRPFAPLPSQVRRERRRDGQGASGRRVGGSDVAGRPEVESGTIATTMRQRLLLTRIEQTPTPPPPPARAHSLTLCRGLPPQPRATAQR